jgi:hypothetical protein
MRRCRASGGVFGSFRRPLGRSRAVVVATPPRHSAACGSGPRIRCDGTVYGNRNGRLLAPGDRRGLVRRS